MACPLFVISICKKKDMMETTLTWGDRLRFTNCLCLHIHRIKTTVNEMGKIRDSVVHNRRSPSILLYSCAYIPSWAHNIAIGAGMNEDISSLLGWSAFEMVYFGRNAINDDISDPICLRLFWSMNADSRSIRPSYAFSNRFG